MSTSTFPTSLDTYTNPTATNTTNSPSLSAGQTLQNDSLAALEAKVGITNSTVPTSLDYKVSNLITYAQTIQNDTGSANAYVLTPTPALTSYSAGQKFNFYPGNANTGAATLNVNGLGTKAIQYGGAALQAGWLLPTTMAVVIYDGTAFQLVNQAFGAWTVYSPVWTCSGTAPSLGNGTITGRYIRNGKTVTVTLTWASGSSSTYGTGDFHFSVPFAASSGSYVGSVRATHSGVSNYTFSCDVSGASYMTIWNTSGSLVGSSNPVAWSNNDSIVATITYEAA